MIFFELIGGLGNQLFEYAFARSLAHDFDEKLYLDISRYNFRMNIVHNIYGLHAYNIRAIVGNYSLADYEDSCSLYQDDLNYYPIGTPITKYGCYYDGMNEKLKNDLELPAVFTGYFSAGIDENGKKTVTEKFFIHNEKIIRNDLTYMPPIKEKYQEIVEDIKNTNSVALHIRRGDYVSLFHRFGMCSLEYYRKAIDEIVSKVENPKFFIFSDDPEWVKENLEIDYPHSYVIYEENTDSSNSSAELLTILSKCKHFIIANSTFSWWGSWLSSNKEKIITAPVPWYQSRELLYTDSISTKKPILIENNYKENFYNSDEVLFDLDQLKQHLGITSDDRIDYSHNEFILPKIEYDSEKHIMIKISFKSNVKGKLSLYYLTKTENRYKEENCIRTYYYLNDKFETYIFLPADALLDKLKVKLSQYPVKKYILKDFEIRQISSMEYGKEEKDEKIEENVSTKVISKTGSGIRKDLLERSNNQKILKKYYTGRIDIISEGENNSIKIVKKDNAAYYDYPSWFNNEKGQGLMIHSLAGTFKGTFKSVNDGLLKVYLKSKDYRDENSKQVPIYLKFTKFKVNGYDIIDKKIML